MNKIRFKLLLDRAIRDYEECTEEDERSSVVQNLIDDLQNMGELRATLRHAVEKGSGK